MAHSPPQHWELEEAHKLLDGHTLWALSSQDLNLPKTTFEDIMPIWEQDNFWQNICWKIFWDQEKYYVSKGWIIAFNFFKNHSFIHHLWHTVCIPLRLWDLRHNDEKDPGPFLMKLRLIKHTTLKFQQFSFFLQHLYDQQEGNFLKYTSMALFFVNTQWISTMQ